MAAFDKLRRGTTGIGPQSRCDRDIGLESHPQAVSSNGDRRVRTVDASSGIPKGVALAWIDGRGSSRERSRNPLARLEVVRESRLSYFVIVWIRNDDSRVLLLLLG